MLAASENLPETNFREKVRCGEVYRNLNGNEMFQKFYYRCLECSMDFESSTEFEEHVIVHYLQDDTETATVEDVKSNENIINVSSGEDDDEAENDYLYAFEVASLVEGNISENDLPLPLMQMLGEHSADNSCDKATVQTESGSDDEDKNRIAFPCDGHRRQALHQYSEHCCTQCPAYFNTKSELIFHLHVHTLPNTVACQHCYEVFPNIPKLNEHLNSSKRKRIRKVKSDENNILDSDSSQNSKKAKNKMQFQDEGDSSRECYTNDVSQRNESGLHVVGNGGTVENLLLPQMDVSHNDKNCCNDNNRKNHSSNDT